jgi:hypothetical protein
MEIDMKGETDWKDSLNSEDQAILSDILCSARKHKCAYMQAEDVKVAQLWCALVEMKKKLDGIQDVQTKIEEPFKAIVEVGEAEKRKAIERIIREMVRPTGDSSEQATSRLVDSLMKF